MTAPPKDLAKCKIEEQPKDPDVDIIVQNLQNNKTNSSLNLFEPETLEQISKQPSQDQGETLQRLSRAICHHINIQSYKSHLPKFLTPDFKATYNALYTAFTCSEHLENLDNVFKASPDYKIDVVNSSATVDEEKGVATVWLLATIDHIPFLSFYENITRETVIVFYWRRKREGWRNWKQVTMRGPSGFP